MGNIDGIEIKGSIRGTDIAKFGNDGWTTIAFKIPLASLDGNMSNINELRQNAIYILTDNDYNGNTKRVYVGQAKERNNGNGVIERLKEHRKDRLENLWNRAYVFVSDNNTWGPTELNVLENAIWGILPKSICINGNEPNAGSKMDGRIETIFDSILSYIHYFIGDIFDEDVDDIANEKIEQSRINISVYDLQTDYGVRDIITPMPTVKNMVDLIPEELFNSRATFLDLACKDGAFLVEIYDRLMESNDLKERFRND